MPGTTPLGLPYPEDTDPLDIAVDMQALAEAVDGELTAQATRTSSLETFRADLIAALQAVLDPANPATAASLSSLVEGPT